MKIFSSSQRGIILVLTLAVSFCFLFIQTQRTAESYTSSMMEFGNAIAISIVAAFIFYIFQVYLPEKRRREIIKHNFEHQWVQFKKDFIAIFLFASQGTYEAGQPEKLSDILEFRAFAKEETGQGQTGWDRVLNGLDEHHIRDLLIALEILKNEVMFVLNNVVMDDPEVFAFFKRLSHVEYELRNTNLHDDSLKTFSHFVWEVFAGWTLVEGAKDYDIVKAMINKI